MARTAPAAVTVPSLGELVISAFRWLEYFGLLAFVGVLVVRRLAANPPPLSWARPPMHPALAAALVGGFGVVVGQALEAPGGPALYLGRGPETAGWFAVARVASEALALGLCLSVGRFTPVPALFAAVLLPLSGHAVQVQPLAAAVLVDGLHVLSAGMWAGGIMTLAVLRPPSGWAEGEGRALLVRFGRVALIAFSMTALTGLLRASEELSSVSDLWATPYGVVLTLKAAGVLAMLGLSALAWRRRLHVARLEAGIALGVIAASALLAAIPTPPAMAAGVVQAQSIQAPHDSPSLAGP
jgi:putative copper export protein